jgi:hypothetical protein
MLNNIPQGVIRNLRNVITKHPNTFECQVIRKEVVRSGAGELGGMRVLSSEDEHDTQYSSVGVGYALPSDQFQGGGLYDSGDAVYGDEQEYSFLIEPDAASGQEGHWSPQKRDIMYIVISDTVKVAYELVGHRTPLNMAPFPVVWIANRVSEMDVLGTDPVDDLPSASFGGLSQFETEITPALPGEFSHDLGFTVTPLSFVLDIPDEGGTTYSKAAGVDVVGIEEPVYFEVKNTPIPGNILTAGTDVASIILLFGMTPADFASLMIAPSPVDNPQSLGLFLLAANAYSDIYTQAVVIDPATNSNSGCNFYEGINGRVGISYNPETLELSMSYFPEVVNAFSDGKEIVGPFTVTLPFEAGRIPISGLVLGEILDNFSIELVVNQNEFEGAIPAGFAALGDTTYGTDTYSLPDGLGLE